jgi:hypothetical protein
MRSTLLRPMLAGSLLLAAIAGVSAPSQAASQDAGSLPADRHDDNGFDKGWLGLIGLAGLLGLKRRDDVRNRDVSRTDANRSASARV